MIAVALHQVRELLGSARFQACAAILLGFFALNGVVYGLRFASLQDEVGRLQAGNERRYEDVGSVSGAVGQWFRVLSRPLGTEFICEGGTRWFNDSGWVSARTGTSPNVAKQITTNNWMVRFEMLDWTFIVQIVVSFLCILLAYDAVTGERERGTLKLILANPVSRARVLAGKVSAYLGVIMTAVLAGSILSVLLLSARGQLQLDARLWWAWALFLVGASLYSAIVLLGCIAVSACVRRSGTALLALVFAWAVLILVVPQLAYLVGSSTGASVRTFWEREAQLERQSGEALQAEGLIPRGRGAGAADGYQVEQRYLQGLWDLDRALSQNSRAGLELEIRQYETTRALARVSPGVAFRGVLEACLGTGAERYGYLLDRVWRYRDSVRAFLRGRDAADPASPHLTFLPAYMSDADLDPAQIPRFPDERLSLAASLGLGIAPVALLGLEAVAALLLAVWAFNRAEA